MLNLHSLKPAKGSTHHSKRRGRGNSSGRGNYSTRGLKGQRARSGGKSGLQSRSIKGYLLRIPKNRGFQSWRTQIVAVNLQDLEDNFATGAKITMRELLKNKLIKTTAGGLKILAGGKFSKKFIIEANAFSKLAADQIVKAGGQAIVIARKLAEPETKKTK